MANNTRPTSSLIPELCRLAETAGQEAMRFYHGRATVTLKADASPLTDADRASHEYLMRFLPDLLPGVPVISEESAALSDSVPERGNRFWLVDPLDGTKEFLKGTGEFTVNVALIEDGRPIAGVVHAPVLNLTYYADLEAGAYRQIQQQAPVQLRVKPANQKRLRVVASKDHSGPIVAAMLARLTEPELKSMGSSLKFCLIAAGEADLYLRDVPTMEWDTAAAQCVVEAAGGKIWTLDGLPLRYGKPGLKNPSILTVGDPALDWKSLIAGGNSPNRERA